MADEIKTPAAAASSGEAKEETKVEVPAKFEKLVAEVEKMSIVELAELVKVLEAKFGVSAAAPVAIAAAGAAGTPAEEKTSFNVELKEVGAQKIEVIKVVRDVTAKGLKESKDLVDAAAAAPQMVKEGVKKAEADEIAKKFATAGAKVEVK